MEISKKAAPTVEERRVVQTSRRKSARMRTLKGAQIVWPKGSPVKCIVRNLSEGGACLEAHTPVPNTFELIFDGDGSRRSCYAVWRKADLIGVKFQPTWEDRAKRFLKAELARADVSYKELAERLKKHGLEETEASVANKISRGTFPATLFLAALKAIGCEQVALEDI